MKHEETHVFLAEKKCALCGKTFVIYPQWAYKETYTRKGVYYTKYYCKWSCYNHRNDKKGVPKNERGNENNTE